MTTLVERPLDARPEPDRAPHVAHRSRLTEVATALVLAVSVFLRFFVRSHLWLDEALSVNIARLPVSRIPDALRHDGAPPLYYLLLHGWIRLFGTGEGAVRSLSGLASTATLPLAYRAGRRLGGHRVGWATVLIAATAPFAMHYATETRMYALVALLAMAGFLVLANALERPSLPWLAAVAACSALLLYTHYWSIYLLAVVGGWLLWRAWRGEPDGARRRAAARVAAAVAAGGVLFLPWVPVFLYQAAHTGTPWARPADFTALVSVVEEFAGAGNPWARILALLMFSLCGLGLLGRPVNGHTIELDFHTMPRARGVFAVLVGTPSLAIAAGLVTRTAFVARYTSVVFPVYCLLAALGVATFVGRRARTAILASICALGLTAGIGGAFAARTQAGDIAATIDRLAVAGDVVAYCPDQLGPAVDRMMPAERRRELTQITYPRAASPERVDWVEYGDAVASTPERPFAEMLMSRAGSGHSVWLVLGKGYRPFGTRCDTLAEDLADIAGVHEPGLRVLSARTIHYFEHATVLRYPG